MSTFQIAKQQEVLISQFRAAPGAILDVRSPVEFKHGHIPGAINFPLLTDKQRAAIGTCYKTDGRSAAVELGFGLVNPGVGDMLRKALVIAPDKSVRIHCARGGLRSRSMAWRLTEDGFRVLLLKGGYKSYRRWARQIVSHPRRVNILAGLTGTGKTRILKALAKQGEQVLDLEGLANHRGSSFGGLGMPAQPSTQHFGNLIAEQLDQFEPGRPVWIEAESGQIGTCWLPDQLFRMMKSAPAFEIVRPIEERLDTLTEIYGQENRNALIEATERIGKKLGGERTKTAVRLIEKYELRAACRIILDYYDRSYGDDRKRRRVTPYKLKIGGMSDREAAVLLVKVSGEV